MLFELSNLKSNLSLTLGYPALNNSAQAFSARLIQGQKGQEPIKFDGLLITFIFIKKISHHLLVQMAYWQSVSIKSAEQTKESRKILSPKITAHVLWSFPNVMARTIWLCKWQVPLDSTVSCNVTERHSPRTDSRLCAENGGKRERLGTRLAIMITHP